jgi:hypothetical protein
MLNREPQFALYRPTALIVAKIPLHFRFKICVNTGMSLVLGCKLRTPVRETINMSAL